MNFIVRVLLWILIIQIWRTSMRCKWCGHGLGLGVVRRRRSSSAQRTAASSTSLTVAVNVADGSTTGVPNSLISGGLYRDLRFRYPCVQQETSG